MRKLLLIALSTILLSNTSFAQKFYTRVGLGYAVPQGGHLYNPVGFYGAYLPISGTVSGNAFDVNKASYSAGVRGTVAVGCLINKHVGIELVGDLGFGTQEVKTTYGENDGQVDIQVALKQKANLPVLIIPSLVLQTGGKINVYARGGLIIPVRTIVIQEGHYTRKNTGLNGAVLVRTVDHAEKLNMRLNPGIAGAMGVKFAVNKYLSVWAEANLLSLTLYPKQSELTKLEENGSDVLFYLTQEEKTTKYKYKGVVSNYSNDRSIYPMPFSSLGLQIGISFDL